MKKLFAAALLSLAVAAPAFAADSPYYGGIALGSTTLPSTSTSSIGFIGGYKLSRAQSPVFINNLGGSMSIEGHYTMLGEDKYGFSFGANSWNAKVKYSSIGADVVALIPIKSVSNLSGFAKLGFASTSATLTCSGTGIYANGNFCSSVASATGLVWGFGAQYELDRTFSLRAGYQTYASDVNAMYVAALMNF